MNKIEKLAIGVAVVALIVALVGAFNPFGMKKAALGAVNVEDYVPVIQYEGYNSTKAITLSGANGDITTGDDLTVTDDATISGGALTVTTANAATSSITVGCVTSYASSSATTIKLLFTASSTGVAVGNGIVTWAYGTCP